MHSLFICLALLALLALSGCTTSDSVTIHLPKVRIQTTTNAPPVYQQP